MTLELVIPVLKRIKLNKLKRIAVLRFIGDLRLHGKVQPSKLETEVDTENQNLPGAHELHLLLELVPAGIFYN